MTANHDPATQAGGDRLHTPLSPAGKPRSYREPMEERLDRLSMYEPNSGCRLFLGYLNPKGYGAIGVGGRGKTRAAHRVAYETFTGPIPEGFHIDHLCRNPSCINHRHLEAVAPIENWRRGTSPGARAVRGDPCPRGHLRRRASDRTCLDCVQLSNKRYKEKYPERSQASSRESTRKYRQSHPYAHVDPDEFRMRRADIAIRSAATRIGVTEDEYRSHRASGEKWCSGHRRWEVLEGFGKSSSSADGLHHYCRASDKERHHYG